MSTASRASTAARFLVAAAALGAFLLKAAAVPAAQGGAPPLVEVSAGGGLAGGLGEDATSSGGVGATVTANLSPKFAFEAAVELSDVSAAQRGWYLLLGRYTLRRSPRGHSLFLTFGTGGMFERSRIAGGRYVQPDQSALIFPAYTYGRLERPSLGAAGVGGFRTLGRHLGVRGDAQFVGGGIRDVGFALRMTAGVVIPIGSYERAGR
jgi:hypothetical protein